jgi:16S rRNA G966 N2-methylase RsmD
MDKNCYINKNSEIIKFKPEKEPKEIIVTEELFKKLFYQKENIDYKKLKLSNIGVYSMTRYDMANKICKKITRLMNTKKLVITDALANMGGITTLFAKNFEYVNACEIVNLHADIIKNNLEVYGYNTNVNIINDDYFNVMYKLKQDIIFLDPPWGGPQYKQKEDGILLHINNVNIWCIINSLLKHAKYIVILIPYNFSGSDLLKINSKFEIIILDKEKQERSHRLLIVNGYDMIN